RSRSVSKADGLPERSSRPESAPTARRQQKTRRPGSFNAATFRSFSMNVHRGLSRFLLIVSFFLAPVSLLFQTGNAGAPPPKPPLRGARRDRQRRQADRPSQSLGTAERQVNPNDHGPARLFWAARFFPG